MRQVDSYIRWYIESKSHSVAGAPWNIGSIWELQHKLVQENVRTSKGSVFNRR